MSSSNSVTCPICSQTMPPDQINDHLDNACPPVSAPLKSSKKETRPKDGHNLAPIFSQSKNTSPQSSQSSHKRSRSSNDSPTADSHPPPTKRRKDLHLDSAKPFAEKMRPSSFSQFVGQSQVTSLLANLVNNPSLIFWGPPGSGKTTLSRLVAEKSGSIFKELSATASGVNEVRAVFEDAKRTLALTGRRTILFMDEIHRFNRAQQDVFLPYVEQGHIQLIGATTENPSFKLTSALLSRCRVLVLDRLSAGEVRQVIVNALLRASSNNTYDADDLDSSQSTLVSHYTACSSTDPSLDLEASILRTYPQVTPRLLEVMSNLAAGDARVALSLTELVISLPLQAKEEDMIHQMKRMVSTSYTTEDHYDMISALHKSIRGSQGSSAMYWLARMLVAGEDPLFICRRLFVCASEDIGLADSNAVLVAAAAMQACEKIGMPECRIHLAHLVAYLSEAPKSTRSYEAYKAAEAAAKSTPDLPVPHQVRNAPTSLMDDLGYGEGYKYNPSYAHPVHNVYLPPKLAGSRFLLDEHEYENAKTWDESALADWEKNANDEKAWGGRTAKESEQH